MRALLLPIAVTAALVATSASGQTMRRSHVECISRGVPPALRAEFRRLYATDPESAVQALLARSEMDQVMLDCVEPAFLEGPPETVSSRGYSLGRAWGSNEIMTAAAAAIAEIDASYARNLDAAYTGLTAVQRATLVRAEGGVSREARANVVLFASRVSPDLNSRALAANRNLHLQLSFYLVARATYESMVPEQ